VDKAEAETDTKKLEEIAERQKAYLHYRAEKDPARGMFTRMYGPEWTETYIHQFLFDLEDKMDKGVYKVRPELASD
jgi:phycoerythrobilin:ferredoxin oxidoreductase